MTRSITGDRLPFVAVVQAERYLLGPLILR
jgi:hypothetical protein